MVPFASLTDTVPANGDPTAATPDRVIAGWLLDELELLLLLVLVELLLELLPPPPPLLPPPHAVSASRLLQAMLAAQYVFRELFMPDSLVCLYMGLASRQAGCDGCKSAPSRQCDKRLTTFRW